MFPGERKIEKEFAILLGTQSFKRCLRGNERCAKGEGVFTWERGLNGEAEVNELTRNHSKKKESGISDRS